MHSRVERPWAPVPFRRAALVLALVATVLIALSAAGTGVVAAAPADSPAATAQALAKATAMRRTCVRRTRARSAARRSCLRAAARAALIARKRAAAVPGARAASPVASLATVLPTVAATSAPETPRASVASPAAAVAPASTAHADPAPAAPAAPAATTRAPVAPAPAQTPAPTAAGAPAPVHTTTTAPAPAPSTTTAPAAPAPATTTPAVPAPTATTTPAVPAPTTTTTPAPTTPSLNRPAADWRPYSDASPFNQLVTDAPVHPDSDAIVSRVLSWGRPANLVGGDAGTPNDYGHPTYFSQDSDPVVTLHATEPWGRNVLEGMRIPVPMDALPAQGTDGHMTIVAPDGWEYDLWRAFAPADGELHFAWGGRTRIDGDGLGSDATASKFGNLAGVIRPEELAAGHIDHALFIVVRCTSDDTSFGMGVQARSGDTGSSFVYPAAKGDSACPDADADAPPMGARFRLHMTDDEIAALPVPGWKRTVLTALAHYGGYVGDTGGPGFAFEFESSQSFLAAGLADPFRTLGQQLSVPTWEGRYVYGMADGVDWGSHLQVVAPPAH